jgi:hypothetical protein
MKKISKWHMGVNSIRLIRLQSARSVGKSFFVTTEL